MKYFIELAFALVSLPLLCVASSGENSLSFRASVHDMPGVYEYASGNRRQELRLSERRLTGPYPLGASRDVMFFHKSDEGAVPVAFVRIPGAMRNPLILLRPGRSLDAEGNPLPAEGIVIDDSLAAAAVNSIRIVNTTKFLAGISVEGRSPVLVESGKTHVISYKPRPADDRYGSVRVAFRDADGRWNHITRADSDVVFLQAGQRILIVLHPNDHSGKARLADGTSGVNQAGASPANTESADSGAADETEDALHFASPVVMQFVYDARRIPKTPE